MGAADSSAERRAMGNSDMDPFRLAECVVIELEEEKTMPLGINPREGAVHTLFTLLRITPDELTVMPHAAELLRRLGQVTTEMAGGADG